MAESVQASQKKATPEGGLLLSTVPAIVRGARDHQLSVLLLLLS